MVKRSYALTIKLFLVIVQQGINAYVFIIFLKFFNICNTCWKIDAGEVVPLKKWCIVSLSILISITIIYLHMVQAGYHCILKIFKSTSLMPATTQLLPFDVYFSICAS